MKLAIDKENYKLMQIGLVLLAVPSIFIMIYGMSLFSAEFILQGYTFLLIGVSILLFSVSNIFDYFKILDKEYDWTTHVILSEDGNTLTVRTLPYIKHEVLLRELTSMEIKKTDNNITVSFISHNKEITINFSNESYDSLLDLKQLYILGWG